MAHGRWHAISGEGYTVGRKRVRRLILSPRWGRSRRSRPVKCEPLLDTATEVDSSAVHSDMPGLTIVDYEPPER
jgi:hypothetical protein